MRCLTICSTALLLAISSFSSLADTETEKEQAKELSPYSVSFFKRQVASTNSVEHAIRSLLARYPEKTTQFAEVAFATYPEKYKEIISASVIAQPMYVDEIIKVANEYKVSDPADIVSIAISAEPSYAEVATKAACKYSPDHFEEIVKTAVQSEPDSADQIAQKLVTAYPNRTMEILVTTIKEVPYVGNYILDALLAVVQEDEEKSQELIITSMEQLADYPKAVERLVQLAHQHQVDAQLVKESAIKGGLSETEIVALIDQHYQD
ncbi:hypothetical protein [Glaciecola sp. 1036]|uniref:hypothetical protein n=1 Tax=Alteromonadaceae TaxID=72275 RepID=UPI003CFE31D7